MPAPSAQRWLDLPPIRFVDTRSDGVAVVFEHAPNVEWLVEEVVVIDGKPHVTRYSVGAHRTGTAVLLDDPSATPNLRHLAAIWARMLGLGPEGKTFDLFDLVAPQPSIRKTLGRKPDLRRARTDPEGFAAEMLEFTAPIAEVIRAATIQGGPIQAAVRRAFSANPDKPFSNTYAERLIAWAHEYHDLPRRRGENKSSSAGKNTPGLPRSSGRTSTPPGRDDN